MNREVEALFEAFDNWLEAPDKKARRIVLEAHLAELSEKHGIAEEKLEAFVRARYKAWKRNQQPPPSIPPSA